MSSFSGFHDDTSLPIGARLEASVELVDGKNCDCEICTRIRNTLPMFKALQQFRHAMIGDFDFEKGVLFVEALLYELVNMLGSYTVAKKTNFQTQEYSLEDFLRGVDSVRVTIAQVFDDSTLDKMSGEFVVKSLKKSGGGDPFGKFCPSSN